MNRALTTVRHETFTDSLEINKPFVLFVGRKPRTIEQHGRLEVVRVHPVIQDESEPWLSPVALASVPSHQVFNLFIDHHLFSITRPSGKKNFSVKVVKPKKGPLEIHLVKKYTKLLSAAQ